ncbi:MULTISPECIES: helix-turn-helix transcriptional regulator [unclassified Pseudactinotalea]|uniref:helix-turn-helix domain-containing protein n=1 Tax=unclassified Pseudactinotalea TaxID=2649176 RepID=UPI00128C5A8D|nr:MULTISPECIES: helix-turn-helix transcriptional regulator [unclassified Pseudactinotalea]MPV51156.1 helix-turn-helix domain-containing protein [Pseudactinotalea sp. HY160]QGH69057.1 helix-turn-helix domain-containing protein [Pseudactinotalea sp. HY158]
MNTSTVNAAIESARTAAGLSQRALENRTGISQSTLNRILTGKRAPKMTELIQIAAATGCTVTQLTGTAVANRVQCAARSTNGATMEGMRQRLLHFIELDAYLDDQAISTTR